MAEDDNDQKTEEPSQKRLDQAFEEGSVAKSSDVNSWFMLAAATAVVWVGSKPIFDAFTQGTIALIERPHEIVLNGRGAEGLAVRMAELLGLTLAVPVAIMVMGTLAGHLLQARPTWSGSPLQLKFDKISPMKGFARIFGAQGWINFVKSLFKLVAVGAAAGFAMWPERGRFEGFLYSDPVTILPAVQSMTLKVLAPILVVLAALAGADLVYQRFSHRQRLRMSKQEVKDEHKESEGDPKIKMKIRQLRAERSKRRMMASVPDATVILTNPTHYSVALKYVDGETAAPICVAKGVDELALRIRLVAKDNGVVIVENPPLTRALYASVDIDEAVPHEHYKAVAEVISFVYKLKKRGRTP